MPSLFVTCRRCGFDFPSGIALTASMQSLTIFGVRHRCPRCRREESYFTPEYHLATGTDLPEASPPLARSAPPARSVGMRATPSGPPSERAVGAPFGWLVGPRLVTG